MHLLFLALACDTSTDDSARPATDTASCPDGSAETEWFTDADADGFGDALSSTLACAAPTGAVADATDCDDKDAAVNPSALDDCDTVDSNCDGTVDDAMPTWYADADADGYGDPLSSTSACAAPAGTVADATDCNDTRDRLHPYDLDADGTTDGCGWHDLVAAGYHNCAIDSDGVTACWGRDNSGATTPPVGVSFASLSAGLYTTCGVGTDATVACWGSFFGSPPDNDTNSYKAVSTGEDFGCVLDVSDEITCWGDDRDAQTTPPAGTFASIDSGDGGNGHSCALDAAGALTCWGYNGHGQATVPAETFTNFSTGGAHTCAITDGGETRCWGNDYSAQCTVAAGTFANVSAGSAHTCAVSETGVVSCWGDDAEGQATPPPGTFNSVAAGAFHTCGITTSGELDCWGSNTFQALDTP